MTRDAGVQKVVTLRLSNLLRQRPEAIAFLEGILDPGRSGRAILHIKDGQMLAWAFEPAGRRLRRQGLTRPR